MIWVLVFLGLEVLVTQDERFGNYKNDLFTHKSKELDRELMGIEENNRINASISSYLRLLSGNFQLPSALRTLEYLIRRYKYVSSFILYFFRFFSFWIWCYFLMLKFEYVVRRIHSNPYLYLNISINVFSFFVYRIHVFNTEELILCALPYHDTHVFVRIVQLLDTG